MTTATFVWEGDDDEPGILLRLEAPAPPTDLDVREALEAEVPRLQDLVALELGSRRTPAGWEALWLLISRAREENLRAKPETWGVLAAALAPSAQGTVVAAPGWSGGPWTVAARSAGRLQSLRRCAAGELTALTREAGPLLLLLPDADAHSAEVWKATGLTAKTLSFNAVVTPKLRAHLARQLDLAAGKDFPLVVLRPRQAAGRNWVLIGAVVLIAANLLLALLPPPAAETEPDPAAVAAQTSEAAEARLRVHPPRPSAVLTVLTTSAPNLKVKQFAMSGAAWRLDFRSTDALVALDALRKRFPNLRLVQFQAEANGTRVLIEGDGYP